MDPGRRRADLVSSLARVRRRIADGCAAAGRDPASVTLVAVTKTYPAADVATLLELGVLDIGENRDQEARAKQAELAGRAGHDPAAALPRWHLVGRLQTNKARAVAGYAYAVHSVDRVALADALAEAARRDERTDPLRVFAQVSLDDDPDRGGVPAEGLDALLDVVAGHPELGLAGVMAVAPRDLDPDRAFARLGEIAARVRAQHPDASAISAGMSADLEAAIRHGATHVRVGTALLGRRAPIFG